MATTYSGGIFTPKVQGTLSQRLSTYASDRNALDDELNRASQVYNVKKALRDMQGANEANAWANKLRQVGGIANQFKSDGTPIGNPFDRQVSNLQSKIQERINNPTPINVYDTDAYKAALANQQRQARYATRQAQESLGAAGLGRSTNLTDRAQRIQNEANEYLQTQIVPTIMGQEQAREQQQLQGLMAMLQNLRADQGLYDTREQNALANQRQADLDAMTKRISLGGMTGKDPATGKDTYDTFNANRTYDLQKLLQEQNQANERARIGLSAASGGRDAYNSNLSKLYGIWDRTGVAPAGIPGVKPGTPLYDKVAERSGGGVDPKESSNYRYEALGNITGLDKAAALKYAKGIQQYLSASDYADLLKDINDGNY